MIANRNFTLAAGEETSITITGNFIRCLASSGQILQLQIEGGSNFTIEAGLAFSVRDFEKMRIINTGVVEAQCKFVFSDEGFIQDNRLVGNLDLNGAISVLSTLPTNNTWSNGNVLAGGEIFPERTSRRALTFTPVNDIILESGQPITGGTPIEWNTSGSLNLHATSGASVIEIMEDYD